MLKEPRGQRKPSVKEKTGSMGKKQKRSGEKRTSVSQRFMSADEIMNDPLPPAALSGCVPTRTHTWKLTDKQTQRHKSELKCTEFTFTQNNTSPLFEHNKTLKAPNPHLNCRAELPHCSSCIASSLPSSPSPLTLNVK